MKITLCTPVWVSTLILPSGQAYFNHSYRITESSRLEDTFKIIKSMKNQLKTIMSQVDDMKTGTEALLHSSKMLG